ncbi:MAG TPA: cell envelope integrity protein CreD [Actinomycetota bacterium]|nr:cell envelope integrity protein CreD [Actinomycetota bacterium]
MEETPGRWTVSLSTSRTLRLLLVGFLALVLLIPILRIGKLVSERQGRAAAAVQEVSSKWGRSQVVIGPALVVPFTERRTSVTPEGGQVASERSGNAIFLPKRLQAAGRVVSEIRRRGIFSVPVYRLTMNVEGEFGRPDAASLGVDPAGFAWDRAHLVVGISDVRAIQSQTEVRWNDRPVGFLPGTGGFGSNQTGIQAAVGASPEAAGYRFSFPLTLNGSIALSMAPFAERTVVSLESNSPDPSFQGVWLPTDRTVNADGFRARWDIPFLGRNYPQAWTDGSRPPLEASLFGVELVEPVDTYAMAERSLKYAVLFLLLTFALIWLLEVLGRIRVHPIQYLLLGAALCLFYLLELSLSEHLGFGPAYAIASLAVVGMVTGYSWVIFRDRSRAATVGGSAGGLYGYLYVLLRNEDYALLMGSVGLFLVLGTIMYVTRRVDW